LFGNIKLKIYYRELLKSRKKKDKKQVEVKVKVKVERRLTAF
jgi:hypothetical protein